MPTKDLKPAQLSGRIKLYWRIAQAVFLFIGVAIVGCLVFLPPVGLLLFWNLLIPVAPLILVLSAGFWRNVCPLATINLSPRHLGRSKRKKISQRLSGIFTLISIILLFIIVPLRHPVFNQNGLATAALLIGTALCSVILGFFFEWKSAWCSGLCPIHPVEKLYGGNVVIAHTNAHCDLCMNCVVPCPDSTSNITPGLSTKTPYHKISGYLTIGGLPGFIWGWFHVPDSAGADFKGILFAYLLPLAGMACTLIVYLLLHQYLAQAKLKNKLTGFFAALGVSCYYWYRIPELFGFGKSMHDGLLFDLSHHLADWTIYLFCLVLAAFFFYRLFVRSHNKKSWLVRPAFAYHGGNQNLERAAAKK